MCNSDREFDRSSISLKVLWLAFIESRESTEVAGHCALRTASRIPRQVKARKFTHRFLPLFMVSFVVIGMSLSDGFRTSHLSLRMRHLAQACDTLFLVPCWDGRFPRALLKPPDLGPSSLVFPNFKSFVTSECSIDTTFYLRVRL